MAKKPQSKVIQSVLDLTDAYTYLETAGRSGADIKPDKAIALAEQIRAAMNVMNQTIAKAKQVLDDGCDDLYA